MPDEVRSNRGKEKLWRVQIERTVMVMADSEQQAHARAFDHESNNGACPYPPSIRASLVTSPAEKALTVAYGAWAGFALQLPGHTAEEREFNIASLEALHAAWSAFRREYSISSEG